MQLKRNLILLFLLLLVSSNAYAGGLSTWDVWIRAAKVGIAAYKASPQARYVVEICSKEECRYTEATSCDEAKLYAKNALEYGAVRVSISNEHATIHSSCHNKNYYPGDENKL